uniref:Histidine--tRNA ligase n=1 Tax=candidate division WOR-3 bacterium TaxID=2052148 RepID=A0A7C6ECM6_UNCW3
MKYTRPKGTRDILPPESLKKYWVEKIFRQIVTRYGFFEITTPLFEPTELFLRSTGESTDIVTKQMYTFTDQAERSLTLRPEGTPGVVRAIIENRVKIPIRLFYIGPMYRYERPQKGRYREFYQLGIEVIGEASPQIDAEVIEIGNEFFRAIGIKDSIIQLNSVGCPKCRPQFRQELVNFLADKKDKICADCQIRLTKNPLRVFDCKNENCQKVYETAPKVRTSLCPECANHFTAVTNELDQRGIRYIINDRMVRGLDYYTKTAFEYISTKLGAQDSLGGGGRYDNLVEELDGPKTPAIGFALGEERILIVAEPPKDVIQPKLVSIIYLTEKELPYAKELAKELRAAGVSVYLNYELKKLKTQMSYADALKARYACIIGEDEVLKNVVTLRNMETGEQESIPREKIVLKLKAI